MDSDQFLDIGRHCSDDSCRQLDFLPFSCPACKLPFCQQHWRPSTGHSCPSYDPALADNRIPSCPLCSTPVSFPPGTDPNGPMDAHLSLSCPVLHPHLAPSPSSSSSRRANACRAPKCRTKLVVPITCAHCRDAFCPAHRFPSDHACAAARRAAPSPSSSSLASGAARAAPTAGASVKRALGGLLLPSKKSPAAAAPPPAPALRAPTPAPAAPRAAPTPTPSRAGLAALRRAQHAQTQARGSSSGSREAADSLGTKKAGRDAPLGTRADPLVLDPLVLDPLVLDSSSDDDVRVIEPAPSGPRRVPAGRAPAQKDKAEALPRAGAGASTSTGLRGAAGKRAAQERESARRAIEVRARKGLLTEDEKVQYATMQALQARGASSGRRGRPGADGEGDGCVVC
ncbi:hypothetical protein DMC30DRAFT_255388 [Rhodotorula diobovata]|uniref:AN1-type domain-containing protein n=1 Tax=Rhodotorula diobovata TaxID=5288 RepID=A0A5C5FVY4_9BASI|nr:hypothetical protein DMC30DRAFT_255388 [Rhodotorula diobovata]